MGQDMDCLKLGMGFEHRNMWEMSKPRLSNPDVEVFIINRLIEMMI